MLSDKLTRLFRFKTMNLPLLIEALKYFLFIFQECENLDVFLL